MKRLGFRKIGMVLVAILAVMAIFASVCLTACSDDSESGGSTSSVDQEEQNSSAPDYGNDESPSDSQKGEGESSSDDRTSDGDISSSGDEREEDESASPAAQLLVYQGMVISSAAAKTSTYSADNVAGDLVGKEDWIDDDRPFGDESATLEQTLEQEFKVVGGGEDIYYADLNEDIYITVKFYNPSNYEILSFVLNGKTYASYMFESGSDMENIIIKLNVGSVAGINEYEISEIKYVDGSEIKYATMNGEAYVRCGVRGDEDVRASVSDERVGLDSISFTARVVDVYSLVEESDGFVKAVLYDGTDILEMVDLEVGNNEVEFEGLYPNTLYQYAIVAEYDDLSGNGMSLFYLYKNTVYTEALVLFKDVEVTKTSVSFGFEWYEGYDDSYLHTKFTLEGGSRLFEEVDPTSREITGLLSDHEYTLNVAYTGIYDETEAIRLTFKTLAMETPEVELVITEIAQGSISYAVAVTDVDETGNIASIALYRRNTMVDASEEQEGTFDNLLSDNEYTLTIVYSYDLNDGNGSHTLEVSETVTTLSKAAPEMQIEIVDVAQDGFSYSISVNDNDAVGSLDSVVLSLNGEEIDTAATGLTGTFDNLLSDNEYTLTVVYCYDLNDGNGSHTMEVSDSVTTLAKAAPEAKIGITDIGQEGFSYEIFVTDEDAVGSLKSVVLSLNGEEIETATELNGSFDNLLSDNEYTLTVVYSYDLNDGNGTHALEVSENVTTLAKVAPVVQIEIADIAQDGFSYVITATDEDVVGSLVSITLSLNGTVVGTDSAFTGSFGDLLSGNVYTLTAVYSYDLNDGNGAQTLEVTESVTTLTKAVPVVQIEIAEISQDGFSFAVTVEDEDAVGSLESLTLALDGETVETATDLTGTFGGLLSDNEYTLTVVYSYDLNDGTGPHALELSKTATTLAKAVPEVSISSLTSTQDEIAYELSVNDGDGVGEIESIILYREGEAVGTGDSEEGSFENLLSGNEYTIVVVYAYDLNDGKGERIVRLEQSISTLAKSAPEVEIGSLTVGKKDISFELNVTDIDETGNVNSVTLYRNGETVGNMTESSGNFDNLLSGVEYTLTIVYAYDLNDGQGVRELTITQSVTTQVMVAPAVEISVTGISSDSLAFFVTFTDEDGVGSMTSIGLYAGDILASEDVSTYTGEMTYEGLSSYTSYTLTVYYKYDLNDGEGDRYASVELSARTDPKIEFASIDVINTKAVMEGEEITIRVVMENPDGVKFTSAVINGESYDVSSISSSTNLYIDILDVGQFDGGDTEFVVTQITGTLDGVEYTLEVGGENSASVLIYGELTVEGFSIVTIASDDGEERLYQFSGESLYYKIDLANSTGYDVSSVTIGGTAYTGSKLIVSDDKQSVYVSLSSTSSTGWCTTSFTSISYNNDSIEKTKTYDMSVTYVRLSVKESGIVEISTAEQLMTTSMTGWKYFRLANDIDLDGYNWINVGNSLQGVFDGNGYTISNMMGVTTYEDEDLYLGLFYNVQGVVMNLEICNALYIVTLSNGGVGGTYDVYAGTVAATSGQMTLSHVYIDSSFQITNETGGTVYIGTLSGSGSSGTELYSVSGKLIGVITSSKYDSNGYFGKGTISSSKLNESRCECKLTISTSSSGTFVSTEEYVQDDEFLFSVESGEYLLVGYLGTDISVTLPSSIDGNSYKIGSYAFSDSSITSIVVSEGVTGIGYRAFYNCKSLTSVSLPNSLKTIDDYAFYNCTALTSISIPKYVTDIGSYAFYNCTALTEIYYDAIYANMSSNNYSFAIAGTAGNKLTLIVGSDVLIVPGYMFSMSNVTNVVFEDGSRCLAIGNWAFYYCSYLTNVMLPASLTEVGTSAFYSCNSLTAIYYMGDADGWTSISMSSSSFPSNSNLWLYLYAEEPYEIEGAGLWHYDENGNIVIWD